MIEILIPFNKINSVVLANHKLSIFTDFGSFSFGTKECNDPEELSSLTTDDSLLDLKVEIAAYLGTEKRRYIYISGQNDENISLFIESVE